MLPALRFPLCLGLLACACGASPEQRSDPDAGAPSLPDADAAPVEEESVLCSVVDLAPRSLGSFAIGDFLVDTTDALRVRHTDGGSRELFAAEDVVLEAARSTLHVEEGQGSFTVDEDVGTVCSARSFQTAAANDMTLELGGGFVEADAACQNLRFTMRFCEVRAGHLRFEIETSDPSFDRLELRTRSGADERIYGMGQQVPHGSLDLKGRSIPVLVQEGGVGRGHVPITPAVNAVSAGSGGSEDSTYYAAPHYLTSENRSLFLENSEYGLFDFTRDDEIRIRMHAAQLRGRILYGESPLELIELFTAYAGRMPMLPSWVNSGAIIALAQDTTSSMNIVSALQARGVEIAAIWNPGAP